MFSLVLWVVEDEKEGCGNTSLFCILRLVYSYHKKWNVLYCFFDAYIFLLEFGN